MADSVGNSWPEQEIVSAWLQRYWIAVTFAQQFELQNELTKLRARDRMDDAINSFADFPEWAYTKGRQDG